MTKKKKPRGNQKYYTASEANAALPLVRVIVRDIADLAQVLRDRHDRIDKLREGNDLLGQAPSGRTGSDRCGN